MRLFAFGLGVVVLAACAMNEPGPPKVPLSKRASIDFKCPASELNINSDDDRVWRVRGCDRVAYYVKKCDECLDPVAVGLGAPMTNRCDCEWVRTRDSPGD